MTQTNEQARLEAAWHESGHICAAWLEQHPIEAAQIMEPDGTLVAEDMRGSVWLARTLRDVADAMADIEVSMAGEATVMVALATGLLPDESIGVAPSETERGAGDDLIDELLAIPPEANRVEAHVHYAAFKGAEHPDEVQAREVARRFCRSEQETNALLRYIRERTIAIVQEPRFLYLAGRIADALLELGRIEGDHMSALLQRWDDVFETKGSDDED